MTFGKYKGKTYDYVISKDLNYCKFIVEQQTTYKAMVQFQNFLKKNMNNILENKYI